MIDVLYDGHTPIDLRCARVDSRNTHGTGCTFSAAITANLALGLNLPQAAPAAQAYVGQAMGSGIRIGLQTWPAESFPG